jgi:hypothetical protein
MSPAENPTRFARCRGADSLRPYSVSREGRSTSAPLHRPFVVCSSGSPSPSLVALLLALALPLRAHDIYTSWTDATIRDDRLELTLTLARASAARLLLDAEAVPTITPENFAQFAPQLKATAPALFEISCAGKLLKPTTSNVKISGDSDITFYLAYPRPPPGELQFLASYLFRLVDGHVGTLVVSDAAGNDLGWSPVSVDQPVFAIRLRTGTAAERKK